MSIKFPTPKFNFGDIVLIRQSHVTVHYEPCPECFDGELHVMGRDGVQKSITCQKCTGSGHSYKQTGKTEVWTIDGMLQINRVRCELSENPRTDHFFSTWEGIAYQGQVVWREDLKDSNANIFGEKVLLSVDEWCYSSEYKDALRV